MWVCSGRERGATMCWYKAPDKGVPTLFFCGPPLSCKAHEVRTALVAGGGDRVPVWNAYRTRFSVHYPGNTHVPKKVRAR